MFLIFPFYLSVLSSYLPCDLWDQQTSWKARHLKAIIAPCNLVRGQGRVATTSNNQETSHHPLLSCSCLALLVEPSTWTIMIGMGQKSSEKTRTKHWFPNPFLRHFHPSRFFVVDRNWKGKKSKSAYNSGLLWKPLNNPFPSRPWTFPGFSDDSLELERTMINRD